MKINFSKSEKNLLFFLTLTLLIFLYINIIRSDKIKIIENLKDSLQSSKEKFMEIEVLEKEKKELEINIDLNSKPNEIDNINASFGTSMELIDLIENMKAKILYYQMTHPYKWEINDILVTRIDTNISIEINLHKIIDLLNVINDRKYLIKNKVTIDRVDRENCIVDFVLSEITMDDIPLTGINYDAEFNESDMNEESLLEKIFSTDEDDHITEIDLNSVTTNLKLSTNSDEVGKNTLVSDGKREEAKAIGVINYNTLFGALDENNKKVISSGKLDQYTTDHDVEFIFNSKFFIDNREVLKDNIDFTKSFKIDNYTGETSLEIDKEIDFKNTVITIDKPNDLYFIEYKTPKDTILEIELKSQNGNLINIESKLSNGTWDTLVFEIPKDNIIYPLEINGISIKGESENHDGAVKNFTIINKK